MAIKRANATKNTPNNTTKEVVKKTIEKQSKEVTPKKVVKKTTSKKSTTPTKEKSKYLVINETADRSYVGNQYFNKRLYNNFIKFGYDKADFSKPVIIVIGNEANGISDEILAISDVNIKIPIDGNAESLNAAVAAAIIMYEVRRPRK